MNILGAEYKVINDREYLDKHNLDGDVDHFARVIRVKYPSEYTEDIDRGIAYRNEVLRHEIIHAFFSRSGMERWCKDEDLVQWIALQLPEIARACLEANCIGSESIASDGEKNDGIC